MKNDPVQEQQLHYAYQTIHDLLVAGTLLKENLKRLRDSGIEGGSDMQDEVNAINAWDKACKENNLTWNKPSQETELESALDEDSDEVITDEATCIGCGCSDTQACLSKEGSCYWWVVNRVEGIGVCSKCPDMIQEWGIES